MHSLFLWAATICFTFVASPSIAQVGDYLTQLETGSGNGATTMVTSDNYGHFVATATTIDFVGNDGALITQITGLSSSSNICVATCALGGDLCIATSSGTNISVRWCSGYSDKYIRMAYLDVVTGITPPVVTTQAIVAGSGTSITRITAAMDLDDNIFIAWQTNTRRLGFMKINMAEGFNLLLPPTDVPDDLGAAASGSMPSVSCTRGSYGLPGHIAFERDGTGGPNYPVDFATPTDGTVGTATALVPPPAGNMLLWVSVAAVEGGVGPFFFYFYGTYTADVNLGKLWRTDGTTMDLDPAINPTTTHLVFDNGMVNPLPPMTAGEYFNDQSIVYCVYKHLNDADPTDGTTYIDIITQTQFQNIFISSVGDNPAFPTVSTNQMGTWTFTTDGGSEVLFRNFQPISRDIITNTLASGLVAIGGTSLIGIDQGDTLRTFGLSITNGGNQSLYFQTPNMQIWIGDEYDDPEITNPTIWASEGAVSNVFNFDAGTQVDFASLPGIWIGAESDGGHHGIIEYNGAHLLNMNNDLLMAIGNKDHVIPLSQPFPDDDFHQRAWINFHAPCTLSGGSGLLCEKARVNFDKATTQAAMAELQIAGVGSNIMIDSSEINMGANSLTGPLTQIIMNSTNLSSQNQFIQITNSWVGTQYPGITTPTSDEGGPPPGWGVPRSDIIIKKADHATFNHNTIAYVYAEVRDPVNAVTYDNNAIWAARNALKVDWNQLGSSYGGTIDVSSNTVNQVWDIGSTTTAMLDVEIYGFKVPSLYSIGVINNFFLNYELNGPFWGITHDALYFSSGTNGNIGGNIIYYSHNIGIHTYALGVSRPFICTNYISGQPCCAPIDIGIQQDGNGTGYVKLNWANGLGGSSFGAGLHGIGYYSTGADKSYLIENAFDTNNVGADIAGTSATVLNGSHGGTDDYAAFNYFLGNSSEQIAVDGTAQPFFGPNPPGVSDPNNWGQNKFVSSGSQLHMSALSPPITLTGNNNVSENDWTPGITTGTSTTNTKLGGITYDNATNVSMTNPGFSCGGDFGYKAKGKNDQTPQSQGCGSVQVPNPPDSLCLYYRAFAYEGIDPLKERDSMMAYCEQHPFATSGYGMWRSALVYAEAGAGDYWEQNIQQHDSAWSWNYYATFYDWLIKIQPMNPEFIYQDEVIQTMYSTASQFDLNLACNLCYNFTLLFPQDSTGVVNAWEGYRLLRRQQSEIPEDTTALTVLTFPLTPLQVAGISGSPIPSAPMSLNLFPNPAGKTVGLQYEIPSSEEASITIFDATGRDVKKLQALAGDMQQVDLDVESLSTGHYFVRLASGGDVVTKELIVQH